MSREKKIYLIRNVILGDKANVHQNNRNIGYWVRKFKAYPSTWVNSFWGNDFMLCNITINLTKFFFWRPTWQLEKILCGSLWQTIVWHSGSKIKASFHTFQSQWKCWGSFSRQNNFWKFWFHLGFLSFTFDHLTDFSSGFFELLDVCR